MRATIYLRPAMVFLVTVALAGTLSAEPLAVADLNKLPNGIIEEVTTPYNHIILRKEGDYLVMAFHGEGGRIDQSRRNLVNTNELALDYTRFMMAGLIYADQPRKLLMLGLGGGSMTTYLSRHLHGLSIQAVELDPGVITAARKYFGIRESDSYRIHQGDARLYLADKPDRYDIILADVFRADSYIPFHLLTVEFFRLARSRLRTGGCLVLNIHSNNRQFDNTLRTVRSVFNTVHTYLVDGNVILVGRAGPELSMTELWQRASRLQDRYGFYHDLRAVLANRQGLVIRAGATVLTDDFPPADQEQGIEKHNRSFRY